MKPIIIEVGFIIFAVVVVVLIIGTTSSTNGSLAGSANTLVQGAMTQISGIAP